MDELDDLVSTTSLSFLGMDGRCARCHNTVPIHPAAGHYRLQRFLSTEDTSIVGGPDELAAHKAEMRRCTSCRQPLKNEKRRSKTVSGAGCSMKG